MDFRSLTFTTQTTHKMIYPTKQIDESLYSYPLIGATFSDNSPGINPPSLLKKISSLTMSLGPGILPQNCKWDREKMKINCVGLVPGNNWMQTMLPNTNFFVGFDIKPPSQLVQKVMENIEVLTGGLECPPCENKPILSACEEIARSLSECSNDSDFIVFEDTESILDDCEDENEWTDEDESWLEKQRLEEANKKWNQCYIDVPDEVPTNVQVRFSPNVKVHVQHVWDFAHRAARIGKWDEIARDRQRFQCRILRTADVLNRILNVEHRQQIWQQLYSK